MRVKQRPTFGNTYLHCLLKLHGLVQRLHRVVVVVRYVYLAALHEQVESSLLLPQHLDGRLRHLRQGRLLVTVFVQVVQHVVVVKQT